MTARLRLTNDICNLHKNAEKIIFIIYFVLEEI
jgi:hypothetical protein